MKPTKMRNRLIYNAPHHVRGRQLGSQLSKDLREKYAKRSVRVVRGDGVRITRGEFRGITGKVNKVSTKASTIAIEGVKKEKSKGDKFDVYIHTSNVVVTSLNTEDKWRMAKLQGRDPREGHAPAGDGEQRQQQGTVHAVPDPGPGEANADAGQRQEVEEEKDAGAKRDRDDGAGSQEPYTGDPAGREGEIERGDDGDDHDSRQGKEPPMTGPERQAEAAGEDDGAAAAGAGQEGDQNGDAGSGSDRAGGAGKSEEGER